MPKLTHTTIITPVYPDPYFIERGVFVEQMVREWMEAGVEVDVVAPRSWANRFRGGFKKLREQEEIAGKSVHYPSFISLSNKQIAGLDLEQFSRNSFIRAALSQSKKLSKPQLYYGKFLMRGGLAALKAARLRGVPAVADVGENLWELGKSDQDLLRHLVQTIDAITCVSEELKEVMIEWGADPEKIYCHPNTVDFDRFKPLSKTECRKRMNIPPDVPVILFTGYFTKNKGIHQVLKTLDDLSDLGVKGVFIGRGPVQPVGENILHAGPVPNRELPFWLNAADLFVLPTTREGYCNAINEAMACAVPVISSDIPAVRAQVGEDGGLLIPPGLQEELTRSVRKLIEDPGLRKQLGESALNKIKTEQDASRALNILKWLDRFI